LKEASGVDDQWADEFLEGFRHFYVFNYIFFVVNFCCVDDLATGQEIENFDATVDNDDDDDDDDDNDDEPDDDNGTLFYVVIHSLLCNCFDFDLFFLVGFRTK
jgi:hypothetical protein